MNANKEWACIANCDDLPLREGRVVTVNDREIAVFNLGDRFLAIDNRCPHLGGPLADGIVTGESVVCPLHGWKINLEHGNVQRPAESLACVKTFATKIEAGTLLLELASGTPNCPRTNGHAVVSEAAH